MKDPQVNYSLSPRFGVSHPITARSSIHFFSGLFLAYPELYWLFNTDWRSTGNDVDWNGNGRIDPNELYNSMRPPYPVRTGFGHVIPPDPGRLEPALLLATKGRTLAGDAASRPGAWHTAIGGKSGFI